MKSPLKLKKRERAAEWEVLITVVLSSAGASDTQRGEKRYSTCSTCIGIQSVTIILFKNRPACQQDGQKKQNHTQYLCWLQLPSMANQYRSVPIGSMCLPADSIGLFSLMLVPRPYIPHAWLAALLGSIDVYQWSSLEPDQSMTLGRRWGTHMTCDLCSLTSHNPTRPALN